MSDEVVVWSGGLSPMSLLKYWIAGILTIWILGLGLVFIVWGIIKMYRWRYEVTNERVKVSHGFLSKTTREADYDKVQDILVQQSFLGRLLNYGNLFFNTAGSSGYELTFYNVSDPNGLKEKLREARKKAKG